MDTSTCSISSQHGSQSVAQRKFYQWVLKWINGIHAHTETNFEESRDIRNQTKPDVPTLASFLQAIGFKLRSFEKHNDAFIQKNDENNVSTPLPGALRIAIECGTSNMKALLELGDITCQCPNPDHVKDASFWSISGTGPTGSTDSIAQKIEETGSNLLPRLSKDVTRVLRDVSYRLFETIACEPDVNRNTDISLNVSRSSSTNCESKVTQDTFKKEMGIIRSYTQPEIRLRMSNRTPNNVSEKQEKNESSGSSPIQQNKPVLQRQKTWDIDIETVNLDEEPRPSPPKITSSPAIVAELSNSLGQISLQGECENPKNITEYIIGAQQNLEKALKMLLLKKSTIINDLSPNQDHDRASVKSAPANISPAAVVSPYKPTRLNASNSGIKPLPKINHLTHDQQFLTKSNASQTPKSRRSIEPTLFKPITRRSMQIEQESTKFSTRRNSFYLPSSNSNSSMLLRPSDVGQKFLGNGKFSTIKSNYTSESDHSNRTYLSARKTVSPEPRIASPNLETFTTSNGRSTSMIKPPSKISKSIPVKIKPLQQSKICSGIAKKPGVSISKE